MKHKGLAPDAIHDWEDCAYWLDIQRELSFQHTAVEKRTRTIAEYPEPLKSWYVGDGGDLPINYLSSALEVWRVNQCGLPDKYIGYVATDGVTGNPARVTNWMGKPLMRILWSTPPYTNNFGGVMQHFRAQHPSGAVYHGVYPRSAGNYCRLTRIKGELTR